MPSPLESQIAKAVYAGFRNRLLKATFRRVSAGVSAGLDEHGDAIDFGPVDYTCRAYRESYSAFYRAQAGIPDSDCRIVVLARSLSVTPQVDDMIYLQAQWWQVRAVDTDPATAIYDLRCFAVEGTAP